MKCGKEIIFNKMLNEKQIKERINELEKEIGILEYVLSGESEGFGRPKGSIKYTQEQVNFLKECEKNKLTDKEIIKAYNQKFGTNYPETSRGLYNFMNRYGIKNSFETHIKFNKEEDDFIKSNVNELTQAEIGERLGRTRDTIKNRIKLLSDENRL